MDFNPNSWYRLTSAAAMKSQISMVGTFPYLNGRKGLVTFGNSDNSMPTQQWQFFPVDKSTYMLRTKASGPTGYLATENNNGSHGQIIPWIFNNTETDSSMLWRILPWNDGTFYFTNKANGRACHLDFTSVGRVGMSINITQPQPGQAFSFVKLGDINDSAFSAVNTPPSSPRTSRFGTTTTQASAVTAEHTATAQASTSFLTQSSTPIPFTSAPTPVSSTSSPQHQSPSKGLSPSAAMGVGATIGVFALITITAVALVIYRRWKKRRSPESLHYRRAKLWKGFTPQYQASEASFASEASHPKPMPNIYVAELPVPPSPPAVLTPSSVGSSPVPHTPNRTSFLPPIPASPPIELPV